MRKIPLTTKKERLALGPLQRQWNVMLKKRKKGIKLSQETVKAQEKTQKATRAAAWGLAAVSGVFIGLLLTAQPLQDLFMTISEAVETAIEPFTPLLDVLTDWIEENPELAAGLLGVVSAIAAALPLIMGAGGLASALGIGASGALSLIGALAGLPAAIMGGFLFGYYAAKAWNEDWMGIRTTVTNGIAFIGKTITDFFSWFTSFIRDPLGTIWDTIGGFLESVLGAFGIKKEDISAVWTTLWNGLQSFIQNPIGTIVSAVSGFLGEILGQFGVDTSSLQSTWETLWSGLSTFINDPIGTISGAVTDLFNDIKTTFTETYEDTGNLWESIWATLKTIPGLNLICSAVEGIWTEINNIMGGWPAKALEWGSQMISEFIEGIKRGITGIGDTLSGIGNTIASFLGFGSVPKKGPLSKADLWGPNFVKEFATGILSSTDNLSRALTGLGKEMSISVVGYRVPPAGVVPRLQEGGVITRGGLALLHPGEVVLLAQEVNRLQSTWLGRSV